MKANPKFTSDQILRIEGIVFFILSGALLFIFILRLIMGWQYLGDEYKITNEVWILISPLLFLLGWLYYFKYKNISPLRKEFKVGIWIMFILGIIRLYPLFMTLLMNYFVNNADSLTQKYGGNPKEIIKFWNEISASFGIGVMQIIGSALLIIAPLFTIKKLLKINWTLYSESSYSVLIISGCLLIIGDYLGISGSGTDILIISSVILLGYLLIIAIPYLPTFKGAISVSVLMFVLGIIILGVFDPNRIVGILAILFGIRLNRAVAFTNKEFSL